MERTQPKHIHTPLSQSNEIADYLLNAGGFDDGLYSVACYHPAKLVKRLIGLIGLIRLAANARMEIFYSCIRSLPFLSFSIIILLGQNFIYCLDFNGYFSGF